MKNDPIELLENQELIEKLRKSGFGDIINKLLNNEDRMYTKRGRVNKSGACRVLNWKPKELDDLFAKFKEILKDEID
jgi:hypothetical protein